MIRCGAQLRRTTVGCRSLQSAAGRVCRTLYEELCGESGGRQCVLVRFYVTHPFGRLPTELRDFAASRLPAGHAPSDAMKCLVLLGTSGDMSEWNDCRQSRGHRAIPLPSPQLVAQAPMIAQLIRQFGLELPAVVNPTPESVPALMGRTYGVFHVEDARGSPYIPAQADFVQRYGVRTVVGFGGALRSGDLYAVILFSKVHVPQESAERFRNVSLDVKSVLYQLDQSAVFAERTMEGDELQAMPERRLHPRG
jgi:hypothetical protein